MKHVRRSDEMRPVKMTPDFTEMAAGSVLIECGRTRVLCTASVVESVPPFKKGTGCGWLTAEYAMLPGSTERRKERDGIKKDGRGVEIQRLIGRSLRAACDLTRLGERTIYIDCDVLQADGGTRTASITGAFAALTLACDKLMKRGLIVDSPVVRQVAAVSVGIVDNAKLVERLMGNSLLKAAAYRMAADFAKTEVMSGVTTIRTVGGLGDFDTRLRDEIARGEKLVNEVK